ncbi:MAG: hypothetical protein ABI528_07020 [bacterium]
MNWKIWSLTLFGILMGLVSVLGIAKNFEWLLWLIIAVISGAVIAKVADRQIFTKGVVVGLFDGIFSSIIQGIMFNTYLSNNPDSIDGFKQIPIALEPQYVILFSGPFAGILFGLVIGFVAFMIDKVTGKRIQK